MVSVLTLATWESDNTFKHFETRQAQTLLLTFFIPTPIKFTLALCH